MARYLAIVNSRARPYKREPMVALLQSSGIDIAETAGPGHAVALARNAGSYDGIISVGGDGTFYEVINGMDRTRQCVGILPAGTLNGIARYAGLHQSENLAEVLAGCSILPVDVINAEFADDKGTVQQKIFAGFVTVGHIATGIRISHLFPFLPAMGRIITGTFIHTLLLRSFGCSISVDGNRIRIKRITSLVVNNCIAEIFSSVKSWDVQDGALEIQAARRWLPGQVLSNFQSFLRFLPDPAGWRTGVRTLDASFNRPVDMLADGELFSNIVRLAIRVVPHGVHLLVPKDGRLSYGKK